VGVGVGVGVGVDVNVTHIQFHYASTHYPHKY